jgi:hypothetical protein
LLLYRSDETFLRRRPLSMVRVAIDEEGTTKHFVRDNSVNNPNTNKSNDFWIIFFAIVKHLLLLLLLFFNKLKTYLDELFGFRRGSRFLLGTKALSLASIIE